MKDLEPEVQWHIGTPAEPSATTFVTTGEPEEQPVETLYYKIQDLFSHVNAVEDELRAELNQIKKILNKLIEEKLDK